MNSYTLLGSHHTHIDISPLVVPAIHYLYIYPSIYQADILLKQGSRDKVCININAYIHIHSSHLVPGSLEKGIPLNKANQVSHGNVDQGGNTYYK